MLGCQLAWGVRLVTRSLRSRCETVSGKQVRTDMVDVGNNSSESSHRYSIVGQTWSGDRTYGYFPTATIDSNAILNSARIRISFDGTQTVDAPLGEFFGSSEYDGRVRSLMTGMDPGASGRLSAWWPMPFASRATVTLYNGSNVTLTGAAGHVTSAPCPTCSAQLSSGQIGFFHTTSRFVPAAQQVTGQDYTIMQAGGHGKFVGVSMGMAGPNSPAYTRSYLEGDERVYVNGESTPQIHGTGTEDYFTSGWYFINGPYTLPFNGNTSHQAGTYGCPDNVDCTSAYRQTIDDAVVFNSSINYGIEHGWNYDLPSGGTGDYSSTAFWYGVGTASQTTTDTRTIGNATSESSHGYTSTNPGTPTRVTSTYEGNDGTALNRTKTERNTTAAVSFKLAINSGNSGVALQRTSDQYSAYQQATVTVDGQPTGTWLEPLGNTSYRWLDDSFPIPTSLTSGKSQITITLTPASGSPAWSATQYEALST